MPALPHLPARVARLASMKSLGDAYYDHAWDLLAFPHHPNVHDEHLQGRKLHCTRESLYYALALLEIGGTENATRAQGIVERVVGLQEKSDPEHRLYGLWHYYAEESVYEWPKPDTNWANFNGMALILIWHRSEKAFSPALRREIAESIRRAIVCIRRANVDPSYTNIALKGLFVLTAGAELLNYTTLAGHARSLMRKIAAACAQTDSFAEYNSPTYAAVSLDALGAVHTHVHDAEIRRLALEIQHRFWRHLAGHFHVPTGELAGPHSRAYHLLIRLSPGLMGPLLERVSRGAVSYVPTADLHDAFGPVFACVLDFDTPNDAVELFSKADRMGEVREIARRFPEGGATETVTWIQPGFCVGTVNFQDGWDQRHNLIAYWPDGQSVGHLRHRYLRDNQPCAGGFFTSAQRRGEVLAASFLSDFADEHPCFQTEGTNAVFLGSVLEVGFPSAGRADLFHNGAPAGNAGPLDLKEGDLLGIRLPRLWIACRLLRTRSGLRNGGGRVCIGSASLRIEFSHYEGERRDIAWSEVETAHTVHALAFAEANGDWGAWLQRWLDKPFRVGESDGAIQAEWNGLSIALPAQVESQAAVRAFYRSGAPWDSLAPRRLLRGLAVA